MKMNANSSEIINSISTLQRVEPNPFLYTRITARLQALRTAYATRWQVRLAVAGAIVLIIVNLFLIGRLGQEKPAAPSVLMNNYQLY